MRLWWWPHDHGRCDVHGRAVVDSLSQPCIFGRAQAGQIDVLLRGLDARRRVVEGGVARQGFTQCRLRPLAFGGLRRSCRLGSRRNRLLEISRLRLLALRSALTLQLQCLLCLFMLALDVFRSWARGHFLAVLPLHTLTVGVGHAPCGRIGAADHLGVAGRRKTQQREKECCRERVMDPVSMHVRGAKPSLPGMAPAGPAVGPAAALVVAT